MFKFTVGLASLTTVFFLSITLICVILAQSSSPHIVSTHYRKPGTQTISNLLIDVDRRFQLETLSVPAQEPDPCSIFSQSPDQNFTVLRCHNSSTSKTELYLKDHQTGTEKEISETFNFQNDSLSWSPDSRFFVFANSDNQIAIMDAYSGEINVITNDERQYSDPLWSRDGKKIALLRLSIQDMPVETGDLIIFDTQEKNFIDIQLPEEMVLTFRGNFIWSKDSSQIFTVGKQYGWRDNGLPVMYDDLSHITGHLISIDIETGKTTVLIEAQLDDDYLPVSNDVFEDKNALVYNQYLNDYSDYFNIRVYDLGYYLLDIDSKMPMILCGLSRLSGPPLLSVDQKWIAIVDNGRVTSGGVIFCNVYTGGSWELSNPNIYEVSWKD